MGDWSSDRVGWGSVPGAAVAVVAGDRSTLDVPRTPASWCRPAVNANTVWEAASLTKPVVALAALAHADGDDDFLTAPMVVSAEAFGAAPDVRWSEITIEKILTHATGLPNWRSDGQPLRFEAEPGTPGYSGEAFELLLAELVARSAVSAETLLAEHLDLLGMEQSSFDALAADSEVLDALAIGHDQDSTGLPKQRWGQPMASGSLHTTLADYASFLRVIADPGSLSDGALRRAAKCMTQRAVDYLPDVGRTLGWTFVGGAKGDVVSQHGDNPGFKHIAAVRPATAEALLVLTNSDHGQPPYRSICKGRARRRRLVNNAPASDGPTVVFLHALPLDGTMWDAEATALRESHRVLVVPNLYRTGESVESWAAAALDAAGPGPIIVVGCSVGGSTAYEMARLAPERMEGLVIIGSKPGVNPDPAMRDEALRLLAHEPRSVAWDRYWRPIFGPRVASDVIDRAWAMAASVDNLDLVRGVRAFHDRRDSSDALQHFVRPIVVISGEHDTSPTPAVAASIVDRETRRFVQVENSGHYVNLEQPERFMAELRTGLAWLAEFSET